MVLHSCQHNSLPVATKHGPAMSPAVPGESQSQHYTLRILPYVMFAIISFTACVIDERERYILFSKPNHKCCRGEDEAWVQCNGLPYHYRRREMLVKQKEDHSTERLI